MKIRLLLCLGLVVAWTSLAWAGGASVAKVRDLSPVYGENQGVDGVATIVFQPDKDFPLAGDGRFSVVITGFQPNTLYTVQFMYGPSPVVGGSIETNPAGNGHWSLDAPDIPDPTTDPENRRLDVWQDLNGNHIWDEDEPGAFGLYE